MKIVKAELDDVMHADFKSWCAKRGTTMGKQIGWWIMNGLGEVGKVPEIKVTHSKPDVDSGVICGVEVYGNPVAPLVEEIDWQKCAMCEERFIRGKMKHHKKTNTYLCEDCADK